MNGMLATKIIEDFMLLANETVAKDYCWQAVPFLYRTHDESGSGEDGSSWCRLLDNYWIFC